MKKTSKKLKAKRHNNMAKSPKGITLVALVITIIVIIILSTLTISTVFRRRWNNKEGSRSKKYCGK